MTQFLDIGTGLPTADNTHEVAQRVAPDAHTPLLHTRLRSSAGVLSLFSAFTSFGSPLDVTLASLRVEHFFPADAATRRALADG